MATFHHGTSEIHYTDRGHGPAVLFLPGVTESASAHDAWLSDLTGHYRVIAADLPGSGHSLPQPRHYHAAYYQEDAASFAALLASLGISQAHLLGFSDGGEVALLMAAGVPDLSQSLFTWGAAGFVSDPGGRIARLFRTLFDEPALETAGWRKGLTALYGKDLARAITRNFADGLDAIVSAGGDISRSLAHAIRCPTCLVAGEGDVFVPPALLSELAARLPLAEVHIVNGAGHGVHHDRPDWFLPAVTGWLADH
jgi:valacyclovir hydrolase